MTFSITEGHWCWCQSISHIWFLSVYYCNYTESQKFLTPFCFCCKLFDWDTHNDRLSSTCYEWLNLWQDCAMNAQCGKTCADHRAEWYDPLYWKPLTCPGGPLAWPLLPAGHQRRSSGQLFWYYDIFYKQTVGQAAIYTNRKNSQLTTDQSFNDFWHNCQTRHRLSRHQLSSVVEKLSHATGCLGDVLEWAMNYKDLLGMAEALKGTPS